MIRLRNINKTYVNRRDSSKNVVALKDITIDFPQQGFVSILGPSGCGKTTLLNILGGLDTRYAGELIVNEVNTKTFRGSDWDAYRNNHVGFVFQEYNLIPHQTVASNVELVLTIAGASRLETKEKAKKVLSDVGLLEKDGQNPNNLSGGQKQRVAIARALVNDPELILADEPTSALDTKTSAQVMDILKEISKKKLVIMVTHNVELARKYSSRIINILDGQIQSDENLEESSEKEEFLKKLPQNYKYGKAKMKIRTAAVLSFKNLMTKKRRTILTTLAGCIGIICLSIILGIINGSKNFADGLSDVMLKARPLVVNKYRPGGSLGESMDKVDQMKKVVENEEKEAVGSKKIKNPKKMDKKIEKIYSDKDKLKYNKLNDNYKQHVLSLLDRNPEAIKGINVLRGTTGNFFGKDGDKYLPISSYFSEMSYSDCLDSMYELIGKGSRWPSNKEEVVVVLDTMNSIPYSLLSLFNLKDKDEFDPEEIIGKEAGCFVPFDEYYVKEGEGFSKIKKDQFAKACNSSNAVHLKVVGVAKQKRGKELDKFTGTFSWLFKERFPLSSAIVYTRALGDFIEQSAKNSQIVKEQMNSEKSVLVSENSFNGKKESDPKPRQVAIEDNLRRLGYSQDFSSVEIFIKDPTKNKQKIIDYLESYNEGKSDEDVVKFPQAGEAENTAKGIRIMAIVLLFTIGAASLLTSLIMIALLEFISVLERTREIGVLRSIGARKKDISRVFKSEALIIGFFTGVAGVGIGFVASIFINAWIRNKFGVENCTMVDINFLVFAGLVAFSLFVTLLAGLIPAKIASRKDPVKILTGSSN